jgi:hypothetical protein
MLLKQVELPDVYRDHPTGISGEDFPGRANLHAFIALRCSDPRLGGEQAFRLLGDACLRTAWRAFPCDNYERQKSLRSRGRLAHM